MTAKSLLLVEAGSRVEPGCRVVDWDLAHGIVDVLDDLTDYLHLGCRRSDVLDLALRQSLYLPPDPARLAPRPEAERFRLSPAAFRRRRRFVVNRDFHERLKASAATMGVPVERVIEQRLLATLPELLAGVAREFIAESIRLADQATQRQPLTQTPTLARRKVAGPP